MVRHFLSQNDLTPREIGSVFEVAAALKQDRYAPHIPGRSLIMFFEKPSTRTRLSFEIGMTQLGGHAVYLDRESSQLSRGESIEDTARVASRYADALMARVYAHTTLESLAGSASIPVINGLSDLEHPCQSMADLMTMQERKGGVRELRIAYVGDGRNNVTHSLMLGATALGAHIVVASPTGYQPMPEFVSAAESNAREYGGSVLVTTDPMEAVTGANVVYTDVWVSMGQDATREKRLASLSPYQVNDALVARAAPDFIFMHCLPAHIGEEVTESVAYGPRSVIFDEAENRMHVQKALILFLLQAQAEDVDE